MPYLVFLGWNLKTIMSYMKPAPSNFSNCKVLLKTKMPKFGPKNALFGYFWDKIIKGYCHI